MRGLQGHRPAVVQRVQAALGPLRRLRPGPPGARRHPRRAAVRGLHPTRARSGAAAPAAANPDGSHHGRCARCSVSAAARTARRRHRHHPDPSRRSPLPGAGRDRAAQHRWRLARQKPAPPILRELAGRRRSPTTHSTSCPPARPSSTCAASWSPSGALPHPRRAHGPARTLDHAAHRRARRPRRATTAAPLRGLARAAPAAQRTRRRRHHPRPGTSSSGSTYEPRSDSSTGWPHKASRSPTHGQGDLDDWTASDNATLRRETRHFLRWANKQKLTTLDAPAVRWGGPCSVIDTEARWDQARRLLHDDTIKPEDRLAGLLVLLYAQWPAAISRLTIDHIHTGDEQVRIRLGDEPVVLPEPVAALALDGRGEPSRTSRRRRPRYLAMAVPRRATRAPDQRRTHSPSDSANSDSNPPEPAPPRCSSSPPTCPPPSSPACSASTSPSPSPGNAPPPATGPTTPPKSAAEHTAKERHSDSCNI